MWLLKTEPDTYGYADLERDGRTTWDGVTNPVALKHLAAMREGDRVAVYHTGGEKAVVGVGRVVRGPYADPGADDPRRVVIDLAPDRPLAAPVNLAAIKASALFADSPLVRQGRLSVVPITAEQWAFLTGKRR